MGYPVCSDRVSGLLSLSMLVTANMFSRSITPVFKNLHHFNTGETGTVFVTFLYVIMLLTCYHPLSHGYQHRQFAGDRQ